MKYKNYGFTLIEVMIGIFISIILMAGVSVFVVNGLNNINLQRDLIKNYGLVSDFSSELNGIFSSNYLKYIDISSNSGFLVQKANTFGKGNFSYIGIETSTGDCSDGTETKHLKIVNFIPYERSDFDIFSASNFTGGNIVNGSDTYYSDIYKHNIYKVTAGVKTLLVGKSIFGSTLGTNGTDTYLNYPTGLAYGASKLFISDTGNNRILYLSGTTIGTLLDVDDGILEPTGLYYDSGTLYISNSGKNELLSYSSSTTTPTTFLLNFTPDTTLNAVQNLKFYFKDASGNNTTITSPTSSGSFTFTNFSKNAGDIVTTGSYINYYLSGGVNFTSGTNYSIDISSIAGSFSSGSYIVVLQTDGITPRTYYYRFFTKGTGDITYNKGQNILKVLTGGILYPTGVYSSGSNIIYKDFLSRKYFEISKTGTYVSSGALNSFNFENISSNIKNVRVSDFIVKDFKYNYSTGMLNLKINYYKNFNCDDDNQNIEKTLLFKVNSD